MKDQGNDRYLELLTAAMECIESDLHRYEIKKNASLYYLKMSIRWYKESIGVSCGQDDVSSEEE